MSLVKDLLPAGDLTSITILDKLLKGDEIELKTHIKQPENLTVLKTLTYLSKELPLFNKIITLYIDVYLKYMVSYNRLSRKEIIDALKHLNEVTEEEEKTSKLLKKVV
ncbi:hypothetical protein [Muninn virus]|nr:hypothetical protein [Muninn virus]